MDNRLYIDINYLNYRLFISDNLKRKGHLIHMSIERKRILYLISVTARVVLGTVFVYAGFIKLIDPKAFAVSISQYDIVPQILLAPVAIGLPALELLADSV